jgi:hypothetical protein
MYRISTVLFFLFALSACATSNVSKNYVIKTDSNTGIVTGSITYDGSYSGYAVIYRKVPSGKTGHFQSGESQVIIPYFPAGEFKPMGIKGNLIAAELPAGDYEINSWSVGSGPAAVTPTTPFTISFRVIPGKATYIGNFHFTQLSSAGLTVTGAKVDYRNMQERDSSVLAKNYKNLASVPTVSALEKDTNINKLGGNYSTKITLFIPIINY